MNKAVQKLTAILVTLGILFVYSPVLTVEKNDFDPNYLISDEEMQNWQSMNRADVQAFLNYYDGSIANLRTKDKDGKRRRASDVIYRAAEEHKINPKYLLVKLQKEQSLITEKNPTQKQLDGATGYGITDGCGWNCKTYKNNKGFGKQVDSAAGIMRWYYENYKKENWIKKPNRTYTIDSTHVKPTNYATAFLYTYTPHIEGNQNFWNLWQDWFGQILPDGSLVKAPDDPIVYLIRDGKKRAFASMTALVSRYDPKMIMNVPQSELSNYESASDITLPNYSILKQGSKYYLVDYDAIRPFKNYEVVKKLGYHPDEIIEVSKSDIKDYRLGKTITADISNPLGRLVRIKENNALYYLKNQTYYPVIDETIAKVNYANLAEEKIAASGLKDYELGEPAKLKDGTLFGIQGSNKIYVVENGQKRHIANEEVFEGMGYSWGNIVWVNTFAGMNHKTGQPIYLNNSRLASNNSTKLSALEADLSADAVNESSTETEGESIENLMQKTPVSETKYIGEKFDTEVDTYLVADYETEEILAGKNIDVVRPMASFTKLMTGYKLLKEGLKLTRSSTYDPAKHKSSYHRFRIAEGEKYLNRHLMYAMLISSLNTPAKMLSVSLAGSERKFVNQMNEQAKEWGLSKTKFTDSYGYDLGNVSTAREMLIMFKQTTRNVEMKKILGMKDYEYDELVDKDDKPHHYDDHRNDLVNKSGLPFKIITSKTGYSHEAGACLVMLIERSNDGKKLVIITMGNPDYSHRFSEPEELAGWTVESF